MRILTRMYNFDRIIVMQDFLEESKMYYQIAQKLKEIQEGEKIMPLTRLWCMVINLNLLIYIQE